VRTVLGVDGGNSKTELALAREDGVLLAHVRGPGSSPHRLGDNGCLDVLERLLDDVGTDRSRLDAAALMLAGVDTSAEETRLRALLDSRGWTKNAAVGNDTFALLRAGTDRGWGIAVVCGAGMNCLGVAPDGREVRFPAYGPVSGDWGGGADVGLAAVTAAARSEDGRGPKTALEHEIPAAFGLRTPSELAEELHHGTIPADRLGELPPVVFAAARDDAVAAEIVERLATEVVDLARATLERLELLGRGADVVLGGGILQAEDPLLIESVRRRLHDVDRTLTVGVTTSPPVLGATLLALDELGVDDGAKQRLRAAFNADGEGIAEAASG
jgi:N-acetylglucosamine kinase-like BadF-type ATPase